MASTAESRLHVLLSVDEIAREVANEFVDIDDLAGAAVSVVDRYEARRDELAAKVLPYVQAGQNAVSLVALQEANERISEFSRG